MSGGHFDYNQYKIDQIACDIEQVIRNNNSTELDEYGDPVGNSFSDKTIEQFHNALLILNVAFVYAHRIDWLLSGDDSEDSFLARLQEDIDKLDAQFLIKQSDQRERLAETLAIAISQVKDSEGRFLGLHLPPDHAVQMADYILKENNDGAVGKVASD